MFQNCDVARVVFLLGSIVSLCVGTSVAQQAPELAAASVSETGHHADAAEEGLLFADLSVRPFEELRAVSDLVGTRMRIRKGGRIVQVHLFDIAYVRRGNQILMQTVFGVDEAGELVDHSIPMEPGDEVITDLNEATAAIPVAVAVGVPEEDAIRAAWGESDAGRSIGYRMLFEVPASVGAPLVERGLHMLAVEDVRWETDANGVAGIGYLTASSPTLSLSVGRPQKPDPSLPAGISCVLHTWTDCIDRCLGPCPAATCIPCVGLGWCLPVIKLVCPPEARCQAPTKCVQKWSFSIPPGFSLDCACLL